MTDNRKTEFLQKFKELLKEYDVTIDFSFEGDTHGIYDEKVSILHRVSKKSFKEAVKTAYFFPEYPYINVKTPALAASKSKLLKVLFSQTKSL